VSTARENVPDTSPGDLRPAVRILRSDAPAPTIFGLTPEERLRRSFTRAGCGDVSVVSPGETAAADAPSVVVCRGDVVLDERLPEALLQRRDVLLASPELGPIAAHAEASRAAELQSLLLGRAAPDAAADLARETPGTLAPAYLPKLRKREPAYAVTATRERVREVEARAFAASYKGLTDLVTKWVWPAPAAAATRWCARHHVTPNAVTLASWGLAIAAAWLFLRGAFGAGLLAAWAMTFLDTVDGKLARVTLSSSRLGDVLDHGLDLIHPPFWYLAWGFGLGPALGLDTLVVVAGYVLGRLLEGAFLAAFRIETHSWRPLDGAFRTVTARRNPNLILLSVATVAGRPDLGMTMVALWTVFSLAFHVVRLLQAFAARRRGDPVVAWDALDADA
jgi:phosphatidylglycerophosphate synthase